ncbi:MAG: lamin tail domain-containing protein [Polyangiaceae bacterium]|nr:lamin tail domain-containing protein [Polyangiaceae bacterium]MCL4752270.1 lamin tail domain-containing protein [Myxococcales bacterium]
MPRSRFSLLFGLGLVVAACSFPEHDFIPADEFEKLKDGGQQGGGGAGGFGGFGGTGATGAMGGTAGGGGASGGGGGSGGTGGTGGSSGGSGGAQGGTGGATGGTGGATGGTGGATGGTGGATGGTGGATGGAGGATGGSGGATGGSGGATGGTGGATGGTGGATGGTGGTGGATCASVVINEVSPDGTTGSDELVELHNKGTCAAALSGWTLKYSSASGSTPANVWVGGAADSIAAGAYFVLGGDMFTGTKNGTLTGGLAAAGGGVGLFEGTTKKDSMAYGGAATTHPFLEGATPVANIPKSQSAARKPNGTDTNVNSADFAIGARTPGAAN